jgi:hypothetical protein
VASIAIAYSRRGTSRASARIRFTMSSTSARDRGSKLRKRVASASP